MAKVAFVPRCVGLKYSMPLQSPPPLSYVLSDRKYDFLSAFGTVGNVCEAGGFRHH